MNKKVLLLGILSLGLLSSCSSVKGISRTYIDNGNLIVEYTDGTSDNLGEVVGKDGKDGINGKDDKDGANGKDGKDGVDGKDSTSAINYITKTFTIDAGQWKEYYNSYYSSIIDSKVVMTTCNSYVKTWSESQQQLIYSYEKNQLSVGNGTWKFKDSIEVLSAAYLYDAKYIHSSCPIGQTVDSLYSDGPSSIYNTLSDAQVKLIYQNKIDDFYVYTNDIENVIEGDTYYTNSGYVIAHNYTKDYFNALFPYYIENKHYVFYSLGLTYTIKYPETVSKYVEEFAKEFGNVKTYGNYYAISSVVEEVFGEK